MVIYGDMSAQLVCHVFFVVKSELEILNWVHFFKTNDVVSQ